jgi:ankyrin repeat protein
MVILAMTDDDSFLALVTAVRANDIARVGAILEEHPALDARLDAPTPDSFGSPLLFAAAQNDNREMIDLLLAHGADINARSDWWAGSFGVLDGCPLPLADFLIERGATVTAHAAARLGMLDVLSSLVANDPSVVHARGGDGQTPLHFAGTIDIARFLIEHGADVDARDVDHESTPAQWMVRDRKDVARYLVTKGCRTDILMATALGALDLVRRHLDDDPSSVRTRVSPAFFPMQNPRAGGPIYLWTIGGNKTAHSVAREHGHDDILALLMERSPDTLKLAQACLTGDVAAFDALRAKHPDIADALSSDEHLALGEALWNGNVAAARMMMEAGWPIDAPGASGETPLHVAAWFGMADMVRELLARGAALDVRDTQHGGTPLGWARHGAEHCWRRTDGRYVEAQRLLVEAGAQ